MSLPTTEPTPPSDLASEAPRPAPEPIAAPRWSRLAALFIDVALLLAMPGLSALALGHHVAWPLLHYGAAPLALQVAQWILLSQTGATIGADVVGIRWRRADGRAPGLVRALASRSLPFVAIAFALTTFGPNASGIWIRAGLVLLIAGVLALDGLAILATGRSLRDRLSGLHALAAYPKERAFEPPRFSARAFAISVLGLFAMLVVASAVYWIFAKLHFASTDLDIPSLAAGVSMPLSLVAVGVLAAYASKRLVIGELALVALLGGLLAFEAMVLGLVQVPALQKFEVAGWLDWSVYAVGAYFAVVVFLVIGSALGFMLASDDGADVSTRFERLVARRHLRLQLSHWVQLAVIATLAPILVYGVVIWPLRTVWRLMKGERGKKPLAPTVFMALLTIVGVMVSVLSLNVVLGVMGGFERDLKQKILGTNAHGVVHRGLGDFTEWKDVESKIQKLPGVAGVTPFILSEVMITTSDAVAGSVIKGIDVDTAASVTDISKQVNPDEGKLDWLAHPELIPKHAAPPPDDTDPDAPPTVDVGPKDDGTVLPGIVLGREMARALHVWIGDRVTVMNPLGELGPSGPIPRSRVFRVAAVFVSGMYEYDSKYAYITLHDAQKFFRMGDAVTGLELRFTNVDDARPMMKRILGMLGGFPYETKDWGEMNANLFSALRLERVVMSLILSLTVLVACICVIATLVMLVVEKRAEVATLKAMGAREGSIMKLFVIEGLIIGAIGTFYGSAAGYLFCKLIEKFGVGLDPQVYYITRLPVVIEPSSFVAVAGIAMLLVFVATIYPARRGGSIPPVEGFRDE